MKYSLLTVLAFLSLSSCTNGYKKSPVYNVRDYRTVKRYLDTLNATLQAQADSTGTYTIPYTDLTHGKKHLIFFGTSHTRDPNHPQFAQLARAFRAMKP